MSQVSPQITDSMPAPAGTVFGQARVWLRLEGVSVIGAVVTAYAVGGHSWVLFALLFFLPDITILSYLAGPRLGAYCYNAAHNYAAPLLLGILLHFLEKPLAIPLIWVAHIGFDRTLGYGLKYISGFADTHLGRLGSVSGVKAA